MENIQKRKEFVSFHTLFQELKEDRQQFFRYTWMNPNRFGHLLSLVRAKIEKRETGLRGPVSHSRDVQRSEFRSTLSEVFRKKSVS